MSLSVHRGKKQVKILLEQSYATRINDIPKSIELAQEAQKISKRINDQYLIGKSLNLISLYFMIQGEHKSSISLAESAIRCFSTLNNKRGIADAKYNIASNYYKTDNFHLGLLTLQECLVIYLKYKDHHNIARVQKSIGTIYEYFGDQKNAIIAYQNSIEHAILCGDINLESNAYNPLSGIFLKQNNITQAEDLIEKAISMKKATGDIRGLAFSIYGKGKLHYFKGNYLNAEKYYLESLAMHKKMKERLGSVMVLHKLGVLYYKLGQLPKAIIRLEQGIRICKTYNILIFKPKLSLMLHQIYKIEKKTDKSLFYLEKYVKFKEKVSDSQILKVIENYHTLSKIRILEEKTKIQKDKAEEVIRLSNKRFELATKATEDVLWEWDITTNKLNRSAHFGRVYGYTSLIENLQTDFWFKNIHLRHRGNIIKSITEHLEDKECEFWQAEYEYYRKNKEIAHVKDRGYIIRDENNVAIRMVGAMTDITTQKQLAFEREKMTHDLVQRNRDLEQFASIVSHNLRAPLANIIGLTDLLNKENNSEADSIEFKKGIEISANTLDNVVADLNSIMQIRGDVYEVHKVVRFSEIVNDVLGSIQTLLKKEKVTTLIDFSAIDELLTLKSYLYSIFFNLITNSIKFKQIEVDSIIEIKSYKKANTIGLVFKDNGRGFDIHKNKTKLFGLYNRFHHISEGKGIGLYMTKTQVEILGGTIQVESQENIGTEFVIEFEG